MDPSVFEKLGQFYLGRPYDLGSGSVTEGVTLYDSRDLTTHAVCVGMTGSGKTGLCVSLLEEAAIDGIPALVIDPKGDLTKLLLTFPDLAPGDFEPWVDPDEAARRGLSVPEFAESQAVERPFTPLQGAARPWPGGSGRVSARRPFGVRLLRRK